ncbi:putative alpha-1,6-mannosyltransferase mnn11 [Maublancomyces gigas]|uniref:Alpha-1,6-mannosyltransferase mnn11 n=1 Tax=Discina gigas TaxID=1032678 RepID=A0ABR3GHD1_9PEZI
MHFALPTRSHRSSPFLAASVPRSYFSRRKPVYALIVLVVLLILLFGRSSGPTRPADAPDTVLVLLVNRTGHSAEHVERVTENRRSYAEAHGYGLFIKSAADYPIGPVPAGWARIPALRHAIATFPYSTTFWLLDQDSIIMNPALSLEAHITSTDRLRSLMLRDVPIVPPESVIKTYRHVAAEKVQFILTQDADGLSPGSMIVKRGEWASYFLDTWYDPLFRFYNFQNAEQHALEHIVQWHPTILTKLALVPQNIMNAYPGTAAGAYKDGDFVIRLSGCDAPKRDCEKEFLTYWEKRKVIA